MFFVKIWNLEFLKILKDIEMKLVSNIFESLDIERLVYTKIK